MDLLGIGPLELFFVLILVILVFGPDDLQKAGSKIGRTLNKAIKSDTWKAIQSVSRELRTLPNKLAREAELESYLAENPPNTIAPQPPSHAPQEIPPVPEEFSIQQGLEAWTTPPKDPPTEEEK